MEDGLGPLSAAFITSFLGLNPCFNGRWSRTSKGVRIDYKVAGLNPCFNGRWSRTEAFPEIINLWWVLILVLMEDGLGH